MMSSPQEDAWSALPGDLLRSIKSRLAVSDVAAFAAVCRGWRWAADLIFSQPTSQPLLLYGLDGAGKCRLFSPWSRMTFKIRVGGLSGSKLQYSRDGWVAATRGPSVFLVNLFTSLRVDLPDDDLAPLYYSMSFSGSPDDDLAPLYYSGSPDSSSSFTVLALMPDYERRHPVVQTWRPGQKQWEFEAPRETEEADFVPCHSSPVYLGKVFYCLGERGELATFNPGNRKLKVLPVPKPAQVENLQYGCLSECGGLLYATFVGNFEKKIKIFKLDKQRNSWVQVDGLGNKAIFFNPRCALMLETTDTRARDTVHLSICSGDDDDDDDDAISADMTFSEDYLFFSPTATTDGGMRHPKCCRCISYSVQGRKFCPSSRAHKKWKDHPNSLWILPRPSN